MRGLMPFGFACALGAAACTAQPVPDSAAGPSPALATEAALVTQSCLARDFVPAAVLADLRANGFAARVPLSPVLSTASGSGLRVMASQPCTLQTGRDHARTMARAIDNTLRAHGFQRSETRGLWVGVSGELRVHRAAIRTTRDLPNDVALSLSKAG